MCFFKRFQDWQMNWRISQLSPIERQEIIEKSPLEACAFQGQGVLETFKTVSKSIIQVLKGASVHA